MGRTKEFDPDAALRSAMELFWRKGYEATSMQDLVDHLGLGRGSIYGTFGGKRELYLKAVDRYGEDARVMLVHRLAGPGSGLQAVRDLVRFYGAGALADEDYKGCLMTNTAVELPADEGACRRVASGLETLETALMGALVRARAEGELGPDKDPASLARFLVTLLQGIRVVGKTAVRQRYLDDTVERALALLD